MIRSPLRIASALMYEGFGMLSDYHSWFCERICKDTGYRSYARRVVRRIDNALLETSLRFVWHTTLEVSAQDVRSCADRIPSCL